MKEQKVWSKGELKRGGQKETKKAQVGKRRKKKFKGEKLKGEVVKRRGEVIRSDKIERG